MRDPDTHGLALLAVLLMAVIFTLLYVALAKTV